MQKVKVEKDEIDLLIQNRYENLYELIIKTGEGFFCSHPQLTAAEQMASAYETLVFFINEPGYEKSGKIQSVINDYLISIYQMRKACGIKEIDYKF